jgi:hypothetical protein
MDRFVVYRQVMVEDGSVSDEGLEFGIRVRDQGR